MDCRVYFYNFSSLSAAVIIILTVSRVYSPYTLQYKGSVLLKNYCENFVQGSSPFGPVVSSLLAYGNKHLRSFFTILSIFRRSVPFDVLYASESSELIGANTAVDSVGLLSYFLYFSFAFSLFFPHFLFIFIFFWLLSVTTCADKLRSVKAHYVCHILARVLEGY